MSIHYQLPLFHHSVGRRAWNKGVDMVALGKSRPKRLQSELSCAWCGDKFLAYPSERKRNRKRFCSLSCRSRKNAKPGNLNPAWKGGRKSLALRIRHSIEGQAWRRAVLERDSYTCAGCSQLGGKLIAHHIEAFSVLMERYQIRSLEDALACAALWDLDNGQTLCVPCHEATDNYAWRAHVEVAKERKRAAA